MTPSQQIYDIQSDMARHDEEGSGGYNRDEEDDYEDHNIGGSGDGSGFGNYFFLRRSIDFDDHIQNMFTFDTAIPRILQNSINLLLL